MAQALHRNPDRASTHPNGMASRGVAPNGISSHGIASSGLAPNGLSSSRPAPLNNVLELLRPGSFVRLLDQPRDLPPFQLIHCRGGRCWVRQQSWGPFVHWEVAHRLLSRIA